MAPFAFELLPGNEAMVPLARAVIGGTLFSTLLTLFLVPAIIAAVKKPTTPNSAPTPALA